jgi:hypothetical protein
MKIRGSRGTPLDTPCPELEATNTSLLWEVTATAIARGFKRKVNFVNLCHHSLEGTRRVHW